MSWISILLLLLQFAGTDPPPTGASPHRPSAVAAPNVAAPNEATPNEVADSEVADSEGVLGNAVEPVRVVLAGDSTVTDEAGWGKGFQQLLRPSALCINLAKGGRSSRSYRSEGWWQKCLEAKPDYLLIQFGHNDQPGKGKERESAAGTEFRDHLREYVNEAKAQGIQPVLVTSLTRRRWDRDGKIEPTLADYAQATTLVAEQLQVPLLDLHRLSIRQCEQLGPTAFRRFEPMSTEGADHTHLNAAGSLAVGQLVAAELIRVVPELAVHFDPERLAAAAVPQPHRRQLATAAFELVEADATITVSADGKPLLVYNKQSPAVPEGINPVYQRSGFLHPVASPTGKVVTAAFPEDHPHQHGIFSAWVNTSWHDRQIDFWNLAGGTGRVLHQQVVSTFVDGDTLGFEVDLIHRAEQSPVVDILSERWKVTTVATDGSFHGFDIATTQRALTDTALTVNEYHYGGMALRGPVSWLSSRDRDSVSGAPGRTQPSRFLNDLGSDRIPGNHQHARWVALSGAIAGEAVTITVLGHPSNFRAPQAARLHPTKPYFCYSPCVDGSFVIDREHPLHGRYRYLITDAEPDPEWLEQQWKAWVQVE